MEPRFRTAGFAMSILIHGGVLVSVLHYGYWNDAPASASKIMPFNIHMLQTSGSQTPLPEVTQEEQIIEETSPRVVERSVKPEPVSIKPVVKAVESPRKKKKSARPVAKKPVIKRSASASKSHGVNQSSPRHDEVAAQRVTRHTTQQLKDLRSSYQQRIIALLQQNKFYPRRARRRHHEGIVELQFTIQADGAIEDIRLIRTSGHQSLDQAATELLLKIGHFDPLPVELGLQQWQLQVPLQYKLTSG